MAAARRRPLPPRACLHRPTPPPPVRTPSGLPSASAPAPVVGKARKGTRGAFHAARRRSGSGRGALPFVGLQVQPRRLQARRVDAGRLRAPPHVADDVRGLPP